MSYAIIAAQVGIDALSVGGWARRGGWVRPPDAPPPGRAGPRRPPRKGVGAGKRRRAAERALAESERTPPRPPRSLRTGGQPYRADTVEAVRRLVVDTVVPLRAIARTIGVCDDTIKAWMRRRGWQRPPGAPNARGRRTPAELAAAKAEARRLVEESYLPTAVIGQRVQVSVDTIRSWRRKEGWRWALREDREALRREFGKSRWRRETFGGYAPKPRRVRRDADGGSAAASDRGRAAPTAVPRIRSL